MEKQRVLRDWKSLLLLCVKKEHSTFHERREDRLEAMEVSILVLVAMEVVLELTRVFHLMS